MGHNFMSPFTYSARTRSSGCQYGFLHSSHLSAKTPATWLFSPLLFPRRENIRDLFSFQQLCTLRHFPYAARYVCTKLNVKSSYNQIGQ